MNHFSLKGRPLQISDKRLDVVAEPDSVPAPVGVGYVDYRRKKAGSDNDIQNVALLSVYYVELHRLGYRLFRWRRCSRFFHNSRDQTDISRAWKSTFGGYMLISVKGYQVC